MIGQTISHYKILEKLGEGGMGVVYKAQDTKLDRLVALKFLPSHISANKAEKARFLQEAKAAAALNHPNICTIHGIEEHDGSQFIVMENIDGQILRQLITRNTKLETVLSYAIQIAEALQEAHSKGIVHRDIKPENIMVNSKNQIKVMDFGLAKLKGSLKLTKTSSTVGTLAYMAPEQIQAADVDARSDIFSFGIVLFEMLSGKLPFKGEHEAAMMYSILNEEPERLEKFSRGHSPKLSHIINRALEKSPDDRYQEMKELIVELRMLERDTKKIARPMLSSIPEPSGRTPPTFRALRLAVTNRIVLSSFLLIAVTLAAYFVILKSNGTVDSIVVMPFANTARDVDLEYLCDGITESIINNVSQIPNLKVISWTTASQFKGKDVDPRSIGKDLNVRAVLLGRISKRNDLLHLSAELIDATDNTQLWGEQYRKDLRDVMTLQSDISRNIVERLRVRLSGEEGRRIGKLYTENTEAYQLYLKGRYQWNKRVPQTLRKSIDYFEQALRSDPEYALAYAGLADAYTVYGNFNLMRPQESFPKATAAARKALELDENLCEAHTSLGYARMYHEWDWEAAEHSFKRAIELNPNYATTHSWYSFLLTVLGRFEEARRERALALELDPFSPAINTDAGISAYFQRDFDGAVGYYRRTIEIDPLFVAAYVPLGGVLTLQKKYPEALEILQRASMFSSGHPITVAALGYCHAVSGKSDEAGTLLELLLERSQNEYVSPYWVAVLCAGYGNDAQAFEWLEKAFEERDGYMVFLNVEPVFDKLRSRPEFKALLKKLKLEG